MKPKYEAGRKRNKNLMVKLTEEEHERLNEFARANGYSMSTWARVVLFKTMEGVN